MKTTTVRMTAQAKTRLDRLRARVVLEAGEGITLEQLLDRLVDLGESEVHRLVAERHPVDPERIARTMALPVRTGTGPWRSADIDRDLYGG